MAFEELEARTADGVTLRLDRVPAIGGRRGAVLCLHAMMTDGSYFGARREGSLAEALARSGLDVYVADLRGHGRSVPPRAGPDDWSFDDLVELDLPALVAAVPADTAILGHSLGGLAAAAALATGRIPAPRALVLAAAAVWLVGPAWPAKPSLLHFWPGGPLGRRVVMAVYRGVTTLVGKAPIRALRQGTADEAASYVAQLTGWTRTGRWTSLGGVDYLAALETIRAPTYAFASAGDWMCRPGDAEVLAHRIPSCAPLRIVGRHHGDPLDPDHFELLTRPELAALRAWLAAVLG